MHLGTHVRTLAHRAAFCLAASWPLVTSADLLERIEVHKENNIGVIHVLLTRPVIYTHHFPLDQSYLVHIYFNDPSLERSNSGVSTYGPGRPNDEFMRAPPNDVVPVFWVAYHNHGGGDLNFDPYHLVVQFTQPVRYKVMPDSGNQGFYILVLNIDAPPVKDPPQDTDKSKINKPADPASAKPEQPTTPETPSTHSP